MRNRRGLNRIGMLALAMMIALGAMGVAYGAWVEEIYMDTTISIGTTSSALSCGAHSSGVSCPVSGMTMNISVTDAQPETDYYCNFTVNNTGSLPIRVDSVTLTPLGSYTGVSASIEVSPKGTVLDPGGIAPGQVKISVAPEAPTGQNPAYTLAVTVVLWNEP